MAEDTTTIAEGINVAGEIVGIYYDSSGASHGFLYSGGHYTTLDDPLAAGSTYATGINDAGQVVGRYMDSSGAIHGFLYSGGHYTTLDDPLSIRNPGFTVAQGINDKGQIVGYYVDSSGNDHGFLYSNGSYITIDDPLGTSGAAFHGGTVAEGINDAGQIVGFYVDSSDVNHGFLYSDGKYITVDHPLATYTNTYGIDDMGEIVGQYGDSSGNHSFLATPEPVPVMLDAVFDATTNLTKLSGTSDLNSNVSVYDGTKLIGSVTSASDGTWSLQANVTGNTVHSFTETSTNQAGITMASAGVTLYAPAANKLLTGGNGNDVLIGGPNDTLTGGAGADTFVFNPNFGKETVKDYNVNQDVLALSHTLFTNDTASQVLSQTHNSKAGAVIVVDAGDTVTLTGVTVAQLQAAQQAHVDWLHFF